jgi:hypothetical protein
MLVYELGALVELSHDLTASTAIFLICVGALAVVWKALDVVARSQGKKPLSKKP